MNKNQLKSLKANRLMCDRVFNLKPNHSIIHQLQPDVKIQLEDLEYIVTSLRPIVTTMDQDELITFPSKISNIVRLRQKRVTPVKPPKIIVFYHPGSCLVTKEELN